MPLSRSSSNRSRQPRTPPPFGLQRQVSRLPATLSSRGRWLALLFAASAASTALLTGCSPHTQTGHVAATNADWPAYGGPTGDRYSPLTGITRDNVRQLKPVWTFNPGEPGGLQTNPLIIGRTLFGFTPTQKVIALDAATGHLRWTFDSGTSSGQPTRGLTYWSDGPHSTLFAGLSTFLYALDPATGKPLPGFGQNGRIDLRADLDAPNLQQSFAAMTTPGVLYKDLIIVGFRAPEVKPAVHGDIRAYDVRTGHLRWIFHTIPHPGEDGYNTWPKDAWKSTGAANNWAGMAVDAQRGIVYAPTGSAVDDFYGGDRVGNDRFANTLLALDANTGKRIWDFQGVHHDIWDRDFPSPPSLVTVTVAGKPVDAVAQTTKQGFLYLFDRTSGAPIFPVKEVPFPASTVPGEHASPTQPVPEGPEPFARQQLTEAMLTQRTPGGPRLRPPGLSRLPQRRPVPPAQPRSPDRRLPRLRWRRRVGWLRRRPPHRRPLRQRERHPLDRRPHPQRRLELPRRHRLPQPMRHLSRQRPPRRPTRLSLTRRGRPPPLRHGDHRRHPQRQGSYARSAQRRRHPALRPPRLPQIRRRPRPPPRRPLARSL